MKKKVNVFGKAIPVFAIVLMSFAIVSAALVPFLSNTITGDVTVDSPLEQKIVINHVGTENDFSSAETSVKFTNTHGGAVIQLSVLTKNNADNQILGNAINNITIDVTGYDESDFIDGSISCEDFEYLKARTTEDDGSSWDPTGTDQWYYLIGSGSDGTSVPNACDESGDGYIIISYGPGDWDGKQVDINQIEAKFQVNAIGTYTFTSEVLV